jgi:hypothetical protein
MAAEPDGREAHDADDAPFWSWTTIYAVVLGALAVEIVLGIVLTARFQ